MIETGFTSPWTSLYLFSNITRLPEGPVLYLNRRTEKSVVFQVTIEMYVQGLYTISCFFIPLIENYDRHCHHCMIVIIIMVINIIVIMIIIKASLILLHRHHHHHNHHITIINVKGLKQWEQHQELFLLL